MAPAARREKEKNNTSRYRVTANTLSASPILAPKNQYIPVTACVIKCKSVLITRYPQLLIHNSSVIWQPAAKCDPHQPVTMPHQHAVITPLYTLTFYLLRQAI